MTRPDDATKNQASKSAGSGKGRLWLIMVGILIAVFTVTGVAFRKNIFIWSVKPDIPFQIYTPPSEPSYDSPGSWAMFPSEQPPGAWETPWGVDVFFIHPTTHFTGSQWNAPISGTRASDLLDREAMPNHGWPFLTAGPIYAPRYRQASIFTELNFGEDSVQALNLAYLDVARAFDYYLAERNEGRGIMLVGVGQGGLHAQRLLAEKFTTTSMKERLAAAYLIDAATPTGLLNGPLAWMKTCDGPEDVHCLISWGVVPAGDEDEAERFRKRSKTWMPDGEIQSTAEMRLVCVNPLLWSPAGDFAPKRLHKGGAVATGLEAGMTPAILPGEVAAQCVDGVLVVDGRRQQGLQRKLSLGSRYKTPPFNLFYADIAENAGRRSQAASEWLDAFGRKPAKPFGKGKTIKDVTFVPVQDPEVNPSVQLRGQVDAE